RNYMLRETDSPHGLTHWAANSVKAGLKLLKHQVEPDTEPPFTHGSYLNVCEKLYPTNTAIDIFRQAVHFRKNWPDYAADPNRLRTDLDGLVAKLLGQSAILEDR